MFKKQTKLNLVFVSISLLLGLILGICAIAGTTKSAEAKANPSSDNSVKFKCSDDDYLYVFSDACRPAMKWVKGEYDCFKDIDAYVQSIVPGATWEWLPSDSRYGKSDLGSPGNYITLVMIKVSITLGEQSQVGDIPFYIGVSKQDQEYPNDYLSYVNGNYVDLPLITGEATDRPIYFQPGESYYFTNYSFSASITVSGTVVDQAGNVVDGAKVSLTPENAANAVVPEPVITVNGAFTFSNVDPSILPATLNVEKEGYSFTPVRITENDIVDSKIVLSNLVLNKSTEVAQTMDTNYYFVIALMGLILVGIVVAMGSRARIKNN